MCPAQVERIRIGHDGTSAGSGWFLDEVRLDVPSKGQHYLFACHRWLDTREDDGKIEIEMEPTHTEQGSISKDCLFSTPVVDSNEDVVTLWSENCISKLIRCYYVINFSLHQIDHLWK